MLPTRRDAALCLMAAPFASIPALAQPAPVDAAPSEVAEPAIEPPEADAGVDTSVGAYEHMLAPVGVNGQGPFAFLIDTGANMSCVSQRLMERLGLTPYERTRVHTIVGVRERPTVMLDELTVGTRTRTKVRAPALPIKGTEADGVLGVDWLKGQRLVLDFKNRRLEIIASAKDAAAPGRVAVIPARRKHGQLTIVDADLGGAKIGAIIDSGAQATLCNRKLYDIARAQERRSGVKPEPARLVRLETIAGESFTGQSVFLPFLRLGGLQLGNVQVTYAEAHVFDIWGLKDSPALVIGMDLLSQFEKVALDFGRSRVRFEYS